MSRRIIRRQCFGTFFVTLFLGISAGLYSQTADIPAVSPTATSSSGQDQAGAEQVSAPVPPPDKTFTLEETLTSLGAELRWDPLFQAGVLAVGGHYIAFQAGGAGSSGPALLDNREVYILPTPYLDRGVLIFPGEFVGTLKKSLDTYIENELTRFRIAAIIVDPGHGGKDPGASGTHIINGRPLTLVEKDLTLRVSRDLHAQLSAAYPDKRVLLTRTGDTYPTLEDRVLIANSVPLKDNEAIVFISIHANASFNKTARGYEVWYLSPEYRRTVIDESKFPNSTEVFHILNDMLEEEFTTESIVMAQLIMNQFKETLGPAMPARGIKAEDWFVVKNARMPSVLVELGFVTNEADALIMTDQGYLKKLSQALYKGITQFVTMFEQSGGFTSAE
jgi:N-acetylmuramoyl-L-alanine amidase